MYKYVFTLHAALLKAIAHPKRLEMIHLLREQPLSVKAIQKMMGIPQANVSQHLQILRSNGVVKTIRDGKWVLYEIAHQNFIHASDQIREVLIERNKGTTVAKMAAESTSKGTKPFHDPVCGMSITPKTAAASFPYNGRMYFFCATGCLKRFERSPHTYAKH